MKRLCSDCKITSLKVIEHFYSLSLKSVGIPKKPTT